MTFLDEDALMTKWVNVVLYLLLSWIKICPRDHFSCFRKNSDNFYFRYIKLGETFYNRYSLFNTIYVRDSIFVI